MIRKVATLWHSSRFLRLKLLLIDKESATYLLVDDETGWIFDFLQMRHGLVELPIGHRGVYVAS